MKSLFTSLFRRKPNTIRKPRAARPLYVEQMEDRLTPANLWVSTNSTSTQEAVREYTPSGSLLQTIIIPASGTTDEDARDLSVASDGTIQLYNGTFDPILSTYSAGSWSSRTYAGWSTVNNGSYGGIARSGNYVFVTDMNTGSGDDTLKGIIRFNLADGTATRFAPNINPIDLTIGQDGRLYALDGADVVTVFHPETLGLEKTITLPYTVGGTSQDYRSITANAAGEMFLATWGNQIHRFSSTGTLLSSLSLSGSINGLTDIDLAADGTLAVSSQSGVVGLMTESFTTPTFFTVGTSNTFVAFREDAPAPPAPLPGFSVSDVTVTEGNSGTTAAVFTVTLSEPLTETASVTYTTGAGTALGADFTSATGVLTFAPGETTKTVSISVNGDVTYEPDETFYLNLSGASANAAILDMQAVGTITNDDPVPPSLSVNDVTVVEGNSGTSYAIFTVSLSFASTQSISVGYSTANGTASSASDYASKAGSLGFSPGETSKVVTVAINGDTTFEQNETFYLNLSSATNALIGDSQGIATIVNDDTTPPAIAVNDVTFNEGNSGTTLATFTVSLSNAYTSTVTVNYATAAGTATTGTDYTTTSGSLSFAPGETTKTVTVPVTGDTTYESNETFYLNLSSATGATIADSQGIATIINDDDAPLVNINDVTVTEGNSGSSYATFTLTLSAPAAQSVAVIYSTAAGTASSGSDFVSKSGSIVFSAGQTTKTIQVTVYGDTAYESTEQFYLNLTSATNATLNDSQGIGTITNDDVPPTISVSDATVTEGNSGSTSMSFTISLSSASSQSISLGYATANGTATSGSDYVSTSNFLTFSPGQITKTVTVVVYGDTTVEPNETFYLNISGATNATIADSQGVGTITNDDTNTPAIAINDVSVTEGNSGSTAATFTVSLSNAFTSTVTVNYATRAGTATAGTDYTTTSGTLSFAPGEITKTVTVWITGDTTYESYESFYLDLSSAVNATIADSTGAGTIANDDSAPTLSVSDTSVVEGDSGTVNISFVVSLSAPSSQQVTYNWASAEGTASVGSDYINTYGTGVMLAGQTSNIITIQIYPDTTYEPNETLFLNISNASGAVIADSQGVGTIINDDPTPPSVTINDVSVVEGNNGTTQAVFTVSLSDAFALPVLVDYATSQGSAIAGSDYTSTSGTLTFAPGETTKTVAVDVLGDLTVESAETFYLNLWAHQNAIIADGYGIGTIQTDDTLPDLAISAPTVAEGDSGTTQATFTLTLAQATSQTVTLDYATTNGTATAGIDYTAASGSLTFAPGETTKTVTVDVLGDLIDEANETFTLSLSNLVNVGTVTGSGQATIADDDTATISVSDVAVIEGDSGTTPAVFTITLSTPSSSTVTVAVALAGNTATSGTDYTNVSGTVTFNPGQTSKTVTVQVKGDTTPEANETFFLNLSNPTNAAIADGQGVGTILDDELPVISVEDITTDEGDSGTTPAVFTVTLSKPSTETVTVNYVFNFDNNTATRGVDFDGPTGTLTFAPGETTKTITATIYGDILTEEDETYQFTLSNATNAVLARSVIEGTIHNDDTTPTLNVESVFVPEGNSGTTPMVFTVSLTSASTEPVTVDYATSSLPDNAIAGEDYIATSGTLTFAPGETTKTVPVTLIGDIVEEWGEEFRFTLSNPIGAPIHHAQARGVISNDDNARLVVDDTTIIEGDSGTSYAAITVRLTTPSTRTISVNYETSGSNAMLIPGVDYTPTSGTLTFAPGETEKTVLVPVMGDIIDEPDETFFLDLFGPADAPILDSRGNCTIIDNETSTYSIADVTVTETDSGVQSVTVTIVSSNPNSRPDTLYYSVAAGTATAGVDFAGPSSQSIRFEIGETVKTFTVSVYGDLIDEPDETILLGLSNPFYGVIGDGEAVLTIVDNEIPTAVVENGNLIVTGTEGNDQITITQVSSRDATVTVNGSNLGTFTFYIPTPVPPEGGGVIVHALGGNDTVTLVGMDFGGSVEFRRIALIYGGDGNDVLNASASTVMAILLGEAGNDTLLSGSGRDVLIGGTGSDSLSAGAGEDLLIGGTTDYDNDFTGLASISAEWTRTDVNQATRVQHLKGQLSGGYNGTRYLTAATVHDDGTADTLYGGADADWVFLAIASDTDNDLTGDDLTTAL